jgi:hypothetical protein
MAINNKKKRNRELYLFIAYLISGGIWILCWIAYWEFYILRSLFWLLYIIIIILVVIALVTLTKILIDWKKRKILNTIKLAIFMFVGVYLLGITFVYISTYRLRRATVNTGLIHIRNIGSALMEYINENSQMPDANYWCDILKERNDGTYNYLNIPQTPGVECNFAFNKNLSNVPTSGLANNIVLLFETDGYLNLSGGPELINIERAKDKFFLFKNQRFIYILFTDRTIVKYRLNDGSVAKYETQNNDFSPYIKKGRTPYSPLRWK